MHSPIAASDVACRCEPRTPARCNVCVTVIRHLPCAPERSPHTPSASDRCPSCNDLLMTTVGRPGRLRIVLSWPVGIALVSWRYMWRTIPLHRSEETGSRADLPSPAYTSGGFADGLQPRDAGVGPM